ncbi:MAG: ribonuclease III [Ruminococcus sp.]|uniref:Ribonuclease 3 n=1 Tax=Ruminococcus albus TaxID=1264 RepID=A0A1H7HCN9_RUMAL|nr:MULTISPECIES: ribonuclease III [Ruminococcus]MBO4865633.1 ribonuclease III [Ruminococcus sp.]SEK45935.1 ribonuclease-3 [Ruminococcus albus]
MDEQKSLEVFQKKIGYRFKNDKLLYEALSHSSFANENKKQRHSNERLEFLGDSVLSIVVSDYIFEHFKHLPEGELTKLRASLVCEKALFEFSHKIELGKFIFLGKGEELTGGRERASIVSDAMEAVIAAIYLDGGIEAARKHIMNFLPKDISPAHTDTFHDYKTVLQEIIQRNPEEKVEYFLKGEDGPDHDKRFTVQVKLNNNVIGEGIGRSKKNAEQNAAKEALALMGIKI